MSGHPVDFDIMMAPKTVIMTSIIATPMNRMEWTPSPGTPKLCLYLHNLIVVNN